MTRLDRFVSWLVGDRCPADPCASKNGLKNRTYAVIYGPMFGLVTLSVVISGTVGGVLFWVAVAWVIWSSTTIPGKINEYENCDKVDSHYNEEAA